MIKRDYYDLLGIDRSASKEEVKRSYHHLAHQFHPDKNPGNPAAEEHFKRITEAYNVLQDDKKRAAYDRLSASAGQMDFAGFRAPEDFFSGRDFFDDFFEEIFEDFFGGKRPRQRKARGADLRYKLEVSLEEAAFGSEKEIKVPRMSVCPICRGSCCHPGTAPMTCPTCKGYGSLRAQHGFFSVNRTCGNCQGEGQIILRPCSKCRGKGRLRTIRVIKLNIPPGVDEGTRLRLSREGEMGSNGGPPGDLYVVVSMKSHPFFTRLGNDILCEVQIPFSQAMRGVEIEVPMLKGKARMKVPAGVASGKVFTLKNQGMPILQGSGRGDQKVKIRVGIPPEVQKETARTAG